MEQRLSDIGHAGTYPDGEGGQCPLFAVVEALIAPALVVDVVQRNQGSRPIDNGQRSDLEFLDIRF